MWKDALGTQRFISVTTRDISEAGVFVEVEGATSIPLHRLVHVQLERDARDLAGIPPVLREGRVLSAVWRIAPCLASKGTPSGYALRFLIDRRDRASISAVDQRMPVAS